MRLPSRLVYVKWDKITYQFERNNPLHLTLNVQRDRPSQSNGILSLSRDSRFVRRFIPTLKQNWRLRTGLLNKMFSEAIVDISFSASFIILLKHILCFWINCQSLDLVFNSSTHISIKIHNSQMWVVGVKTKLSN